MKEIPLTQGYVAVVDDEDYERVSSLKWSIKMCFGERPGPPKAQHNRQRRRKPEEMGLFLLSHPVGIVTRLKVSHSPDTPLDYRRSNLIVWPDRALDQHLHKRMKSQFGLRGVTVQKGNFYAQAGGVYLGAYPSAEAAARAYDKAVHDKFGIYAFQNFPKEMVN